MEEYFSLFSPFKRMFIIFERERREGGGRRPGREGWGGGRAENEGDRKI